ncbi:LOW QUALITY PROTEIN: hypothetical protein U9M48_032834 [Paspalum notatum var. saurae]|uniref:Uncharacterized protein n=1 Tax=Paspalum notatum var. saurae TaxID=547442 RepID=A0AAQ3U5Z5_PASNO
MESPAKGHQKQQHPDSDAISGGQPNHESLKMNASWRLRTEGHVEAADLELAVLLAESAGLAAEVDAAVGAGLLREAVLRTQLGAVAAGVEAAQARGRRQQQVAPWSTMPAILPYKLWSSSKHTQAVTYARPRSDSDQRSDEDDDDDLQPPASSKQSQRPDDHAPAAGWLPSTPKLAP